MTGAPGSDNDEREERFDELVADYLDALSAGETIDEERMLKENPDFADELKVFFRDHHRMGGLLDQGDRDSESIAAPSNAPKTRPTADAPTLAHETSATNRRAGVSSQVPSEECIDDYQLLERIAEGGMGVVYKARQLSLNRTVALKMIRTGEFADREEILRFKVEAEAAAKLNHPGIVPIYQIGEDKGQHFFSMAFVQGPSLAAMIRQTPLKPRRAAGYVAKIARAVHFAHEQGIIHRDIKPANVLVDENDQPLVTDFGLAKQISADHELTMSGQILGTASYMSPEQAGGKQVTPSADVYSLGALLYALLTKQPPFTGENPVDILLDVLSKDPASPSSLNISLSRDLETICMRCLEKEPLRRYGSAAELADDLERFLDGTPIHARPVGSIEKWVRWCQRRPAVATAVFLSVMLCLSAAAYFAKDSSRRVFASSSPTNRQAFSLLEHARKHYAKLPQTRGPIEDQLMQQAAMAMLSLGPKFTRDPICEEQFEALANELKLASNANPENLGFKSALADCLLQLARFRIPPYDLRNPGSEFVAEEDAATVESSLRQALALLEQLQDRHPESNSLRARRATIQVSLGRLPSTFDQRREQMLAAVDTSKTWDDSYGVIRFRWQQLGPVVPQAGKSTGFSAQWVSAFQEAHLLCRQSRYLESIRAYRNLALMDSPPEAYEPLFYDLSVLANHKPDAILLDFVLPSDPKAIYYASLGIRQASVR